MTKTCKTCGRVLPLEEFPIGKLNAGGRRPHCKPCYSKYTYGIHNPEATKRATAKYLASEHGKTKRQEIHKRRQPLTNESTRKWRARDPEHVKELDRQCKYNLNRVQFTALCEHDKVCAVCKRKRTLHIDHNHKTLQVRGRLCVRCNTAIGKLGDDLAGVMRAVRYLEERDNVTGLPWQ